jgi:myosin heavy subunit
MASTSLPPHLFAVAERAMRHAYQQVDDQTAEKPKDQAVIISGESGSGKTEATKLIVQYLSWRSKAVHDDQVYTNCSCHISL